MYLFQKITKIGVMLINLDKDFYAIGVGDPEGFPAIEFDLSTGTSIILIFSSLELAKQYTYLRRPELEKNTYKLSKVTYEGKIIQSELLKIARLAKKYRNVKHFVFDHPGKIGTAQYLTIQEVLMFGRQNVKNNQKNELISFLDDQD